MSALIWNPRKHSACRRKLAPCRNPVNPSLARATKEWRVPPAGGKLAGKAASRGLVPAAEIV